MMSEEKNYLLDDLKREIEILRRVNKDLNRDNQRLTEENKTLQRTLDKYEDSFKMQNDHVTSLRELAVKDREWLDLKVSFRQSKLSETKQKTAAIRRRASNQL